VLVIRLKIVIRRPARSADVDFTSRAMGRKDAKGPESTAALADHQHRRKEPSKSKDDPSASEEETKSTPPKAAGWQHQFTSRFVIQSKEVSHQRMLVCMCVFAASAECFTTVVMPSHGFRGYDLTGTSCNFLGAFLAGLALKLGNLGPKASTLSDVFRGGFISTLTSFCFMVEESAALQCSKSTRSLYYFISCVLLGPCFWGLGHRVGDNLLVLLKSMQHEKGDDHESVKVTLRHARYAMTSWVVVAIAMEGQLRGLAAAWELVVGVMMSMSGIVAGDAVGLLAPVLLDFESDVNWATMLANAFALMFVSMVAFCRPAMGGTLTPLGWFFSVVTAKFCGSFCGTLSGYGAFSEDVAGEIVKSKIDTAAANLGMNALLACVFMAFLHHVSCGDSIF